MEKKSWANSARVWNEIKSILKNNDRLVMYDLETTGLKKDKDRFIQIAAIRYMINDDLSLTYEDEFVRLVNPGYLISGEISDLTGITNDDLERQPTEDEIFDEVMDFFRDYPVGGYNIRAFDNAFMQYYYDRQGVSWEPSGIVDVIELARKVIRKDEVENYKLGTIGAYFGVDFRAHDAKNDTAATADVFNILIKECLEMEKNRSTVGLVKPKVYSVHFWEGYRGYSRIYVSTSAGKIYYDIRNSCWGGKDADIDLLDMPFIEKEAWKLANCTSEAEFKRYRGVS